MTVIAPIRVVDHALTYGRASGIDQPESPGGAQTEQRRRPRGTWRCVNGHDRCRGFTPRPGLPLLRAQVAAAMKIWLRTRNTNVGVLRDELIAMGVALAGFDHSARCFVGCSIPSSRPAALTDKSRFLVTEDDVTGFVDHADSFLLFRTETSPALARPGHSFDVVGPQPRDLECGQDCHSVAWCRRNWCHRTNMQ